MRCVSNFKFSNCELQQVSPPSFVSSPVQLVAGGTTWNCDTADSANGVTQFAFSTNPGSNTFMIKNDTTLWALNKGVVSEVFSGTTGWAQVSSGNSSTAWGPHGSLKTDGTLWFWGINCYGSFGNNGATTGSGSSPVQTITGGSTWCALSVSGQGATAAVKTDGTLWVWGNNGRGNLGINSVANRSSPVQTVAGGTNWSKVSASKYATAATKTDGTLWMWGQNQYGQLGNNSITNRSSPVQTIAGGTNWKQVETGGLHSTMAIKTDGTLWSWGRGCFLGTGTATHSSSPVQTSVGGTTWKQVAAGSLSTIDGKAFGVKTDGTLWMWDNVSTAAGAPRQHYLSATDWTNVGVRSTGLQGYTAMSVKNNGTLWAWGCIPSSAGIACPNAFWQFLPDLISCCCSVSRDFDDAFVRKEFFADGGLWLWGGNTFCGSIGDNTTVSKSSPVQTIAGGTNWKQADGVLTVSAIKSDGTLWVWGAAAYGTLGDNTVVTKSSPVQTIAGGTNWKFVTTGTQATAAIKTDGTLWIWGKGNYGALGTNSVAHQSSPVQTIAGGTNWKQVSGTRIFMGAIKTDGTLWVWGCNNGNLGDNTTVAKSSPVQTIAGGTNWSCVVAWSAATGANGFKAIKTDGTLWNWGYNTKSFLGDNTTVSKSSPVQTIAGGTNWKELAQFGAIKTDGTLWFWGCNGYGNFGNYSVGTQFSSPVQTISGGSNWKKIVSSLSQAAALKTDGTLWVWGSGSSGALGDNTTITKSSPVQTIAGGTTWSKLAIFNNSSLAIRESCW